MRTVKDMFASLLLYNATNMPKICFRKSTGDIYFICELCIII